jgi:hypothetical protein
MKAITVCVGFDDLLEFSLPYNRHHFDEVMVVTYKEDKKTIKVATQNNARVFLTDSFYADGAAFNKFKALEEGLDAFGRVGLLCIMDADVVWPNYINICPEFGKMYTPRRRMMVDIQTLSGEGIPPEKLWGVYPIHHQAEEFAGYTQIFHANDPVLGSPPWHETNWKTAGAADSWFQQKWASENKIRPNFEVLHLGPAGTNWCGRASQLVDGTLPEKAVERQKQLNAIWEARRNARRNGLDPFASEKMT